MTEEIDEKIVGTRISGTFDAKKHDPEFTFFARDKIWIMKINKFGFHFNRYPKLE